VSLTGLHLLLTLRCTRACRHCFVWGSPHQRLTMTCDTVDDLLAQASGVGTVTSIYFEGGEPFLAYPVLVHGVDAAHRLGFTVGVVSNGYWATSVEVACRWLEPLAGKVDDLSVSADPFHAELPGGAHTRCAIAAAERLGIPAQVLSVGDPQADGRDAAPVMFRGRAARELAPNVVQQAWQDFDSCPHERLEEPSRVHIDPLGNLHVCQGVSIGRIGNRHLRGALEAYVPARDPIVGPLVRGGPAELARVHGIGPRATYADACHLCDDVRGRLRPWFPDTLTPPALYGEFPNGRGASVTAAPATAGRSASPERARADAEGSA
jgi:hypothetical protein